jgi:hypothetical protein
MLGDSGKNVNGEAICLREVNGDELHPGFHEGRDEVDVAGEAIQLGNNKSGAMQSAEAECFGDGGAIIAFAALNLNYLTYKRPAPAVKVICDGFTLGFESQAAHTLPGCRNSQVTNEFAVCHRSPPPGTFASTFDVVNVQGGTRICKRKLITATKFISSLAVGVEFLHQYAREY